MDKFTFSLVRDESGSIDINSSLQSVSDALGELVAEETESRLAIAEAVQAVWDERPGVTSLSTEAICHYAMVNMEVDEKSKNFKNLKNSIQSYLRSNKDLFHISRGKEGVQLKARMTAEKLAKVNGVVAVAAVA